MSNLLASAKENLSVLLVCLGVFAALVLIALGAERLLKTRRSISSARYITVTEGMETDFYVEVLSDELTEGLRIVATSDLIPEGTVVQVA